MNDQQNGDTTPASPVPDDKSQSELKSLAVQSKPHPEVESLICDLTKTVHEARTSATKADRARSDAESSLASIEHARAEVAAQKTTLEEHARESRSVAGELKSLIEGLQTAATQVRETVAVAQPLLESLRGMVGTATEISGRMEALKTQVEQAAQVADKRSQHIEEGRVYVDAKRAEFDNMLNTAQRSAASAESQYQASKIAATGSNEVLASVLAAKGTIDGTVAMIARLHDQSKTHAETTKGLAETAESIKNRIDQYESSLVELERSAKERLATIDSLLPHAAATGLASAFFTRRTQFRRPMWIWQAVFVASILAVLALACLHSGPSGVEFSLLPRIDGKLSLDQLGLSLLARLPFALPLIWLAIHSSQKAALAQRVEEDYGFKEAVSRSFEGFRREMADLEGKVQPTSPLAVLCGGVLGVVTNPPGRIYEKHPLNQTPFQTIAETAAPLAGATGIFKGTI